jgi:hypothetical protein
MRFQDRLLFVVPVLMAVGVVNCIVAYHKGGIRQLILAAGIWLTLLAFAILLNFIRRRSRQSEDRHSPERYSGKGPNMNLLHPLKWNGKDIGWIILLAGLVIAGYTFGFVAGATVTAVAIAILFAYHWLLTRQENTDRRVGDP